MKHLLPVSKWANNSSKIHLMSKITLSQDPCKIWGRFHMTTENTRKSFKVAVAGKFAISAKKWVWV
jgi:hypothetical protein